MKKRILCAASTAFILVITAIMLGCGGSGSGKNQGATDTTSATDQQETQTPTNAETDTQTPATDPAAGNSGDAQTPQTPTQTTPQPPQTQTPPTTPVVSPTPQAPEPQQPTTPVVQPQPPPTTPVAQPQPTPQPPTPTQPVVQPQPEPQTPITNPEPEPQPPTTPVTDPVEPDGGSEQAIDERQRMYAIFNGSTVEFKLAAESKFLINGQQATITAMKSIKEFLWNDFCVGWHELGGRANMASAYLYTNVIVIRNMNPGGIGNWSMISRDDHDLYVDLSYLSASGVDYYIKDGLFYYGTAVMKDENGNTVPDPYFKCQ